MNDTVQKTNKIFSKGISFLKKGDYPTAIHYFQKLEKLGPDNVEILNNIGVACKKLGDYALALKYLSKAIELNPKHSDILQNITDLYLCLNEFDKAFEHAVSALDLQVKDIGFFIHTIQTLVSKDKHQLAYQLFNKLQKTNSYSPQKNLVLNMSKLLAQKKECDKAANLLKDELNIKHDDDVLNRLLVLYGKNKQQEKAISFLEEQIQKSLIL